MQDFAKALQPMAICIASSGKIELSGACSKREKGPMKPDHEEMQAFGR
jgi:hypothetical protein